MLSDGWHLFSVIKFAVYVPKHFEEPRVGVMHELIRARPLATLVTMSSVGINANHIPLQISEEPSPFGTLRGHVARSNPLWSDLNSNVEALAIFHGPDAYITPSWYPTKKDTGKVVPTWNFAVVHAYGTLRVIDDPSWVRAQVESLTDHNEQKFADPWKVADAPHEYTTRLIEGIVGIEVVITRLSGKWKVSQNLPPQNQAGVIDGLEKSELSDESSVATLMNLRKIQGS